MIIELSPGRHDIFEREDYGRLKLRAPSGWDCADIARGLPFEAVCEPEYVWIRETDLRALAQTGVTSPDPIAGMVEKARKYGFYDAASGAVRVHIEFY